MSIEELKNKKIVLFFSYRVSLKVWDDFGMLSREKRISELFSRNFREVCFLTYGDKDEQELVKAFPGIKLLNNKWGLNPFIYSILAPFLYAGELSRADYFKMNQLSAAMPAVISKILYKKKLIVRCGFQLSLFLKRQKENYFKILLAFVLERISFKLADKIIAATQACKEHIVEQHKIAGEKIEVIPNGIDIDRFNVLEGTQKKSGKILFVGRFIEQKNLFALLEALKSVKEAHLVMIGRGKLRDSLSSRAEEYGIDVMFIDNVKNEDLPVEYNKAELFVLPSLFEGNPKVLLEAMACGLSVVASDVEGINSMIKHSHDGILCEPSPGNIRKEIVGLLNDREKRRKLGENARAAIIEKFSLNSVLEKELLLISR